MSKYLAFVSIFEHYKRTLKILTRQKTAWGCVKLLFTSAAVAAVHSRFILTRLRVTVTGDRVRSS